MDHLRYNSQINAANNTTTEFCLEDVGVVWWFRLRLLRTSSKLYLCVTLNVDAEAALSIFSPDWHFVPRKSQDPNLNMTSLSTKSLLWSIEAKTIYFLDSV